MTLLLALSSAGVLGGDMPNALCGPGKYKYCIEAVGYDQATGETYVKDMDDGMCLSYNGDFTFTKVDCVTELASATKFIWDTPAANNLQAIYPAAMETLCLHVYFGITMKTCQNDVTFIQQQWAPHWKSSYDGCVDMKAGNTVGNQCPCRPQANKVMGAVESLTVYQNCMSGRVRGATGARTLTSMRPENFCNGQPAPLQTLADWNDPNSMFVYWQEDTQDFTTAATYVTKVTYSDTEATIVKELKLPGCVQGGNIIRGKGDKLAMLCAEYDVAWGGSVGNLKIVEVEYDLSREVRRFTVLPDEVIAANGDEEGKYPFQKGADFRYLEWVPTKNWYVAFYNAGWGIHVADEMRMYDADTETWVRGAGSGWACQNGHTQTGRMVYNADLDELAALCCSDSGGQCTDPADSKQACDAGNVFKNGMTMRTHVNSKIGPIALAPFSNVYSQAIGGWLGDIVPCGDGFAVVWVGPEEYDSYGAKSNNVGFMRVTVDGTITLKTWPTGLTPTLRARSAKLAKLGTGDCDRFLLGWGDMDTDHFYPNRYQLVELDGDGKQITTPFEVTSMTQWAEETVWTTTSTGDVVWAHTWKRNIDGSPNLVGRTAHGTQSGKGNTCTYDEGGYGYSWGSDPSSPGRRFHTNEAFFMRYKANEVQILDECLEVPAPCGVGQTCADPNTSPTSIKDFTCTCDDDMAVFATGAAATCAIDECVAAPCGMGQTCNDPDTKYGSQHDFVCTCDNDAAITNVDGPATCFSDECLSVPCGMGQTCNDPNPSPGSIKDFTCTCDDDMAVFATGTAATCAIDECTAPMVAPCGTGQTCNDPDTKYGSQHDFVCTCDNDVSLTKVDGPATCSKDECTPNPCSVGQTCNDPNPSPTSIKDFTCTCDDDMAVFATGTAATCAIDECTAPMVAPCGMGQTCNDPDTKYASQHDFVCTCDNDAAITKVDGPATCSKDECTPNPCSVGQTCNDPNPSPTSIKDFTCTCDDDMAVFATGTAATCAIDECTAPMVAPCGTGQTCSDPDTKYGSQHDFVCTCDNDASLTQVDGPATCSKDECTPNPCSAGQTCNDPNPSPGSIKDFTCTCDNDVAVFATGAQVAMCEVDECATTPCGAGQSCIDADTKIASRNDFVCTCSNDAAITQTGSAAMCTVDECLTMPCGTQKCTDTNNAANSLTDFECECANGVKNVGGPATCMSGSNDECLSDPCSGQTCVDPDTTVASTLDYLCTCVTGTGSATGMPAVCVVDECETDPCGSSQDCADPVQTDASKDDFECSCRAPAAGKMVGALATCEVDECLASPCAVGQTCLDANKAPTSVLDFTCTCDSNGVQATGGAATCEADECAAMPCGTGQTCNDPDMSYVSQHDFVCTCDNDAALTKVDGPATCFSDECRNSPCAMGQTCNDPNPAKASLKDFTCTCDSNGVQATGGAATCEVDECAATPCGTGQTCNDPDMSYMSQHDFVCTCDNDMSLTKVDGPATCFSDECRNSPCATGQTCNDPNPTRTSLKDFTCTCDSNGVQATGGAATCEVDECATAPCGTGQTCNDPDMSYMSQHDFVCTCDNDVSLTKVDGPATCFSDECRNSPCGMGQTCNDPNPTRTSLKDFTCTCDSNGVQATGGSATCAEDECTTPTIPPCGMGQTCKDPNTSYLSKHDFVCTCDNDVARTNVDGPARCFSDECRNAPCGSGQKCEDPNQGFDTLKDFTCTCANGVQAVGGAATCELDECEKKPCGADQTCVDDDTRYTARRDYMCACVQTGTKARGQPANCDLRATSEPGIDTLAPVDTAAPTFPPNVQPTDAPTFPPNVVPTLPPAVPETFPPNVPETRVPMTTEVTGRVNQTVGGGKPFDKKEYKRIVSEKTGVPEDEFEVTTTTLPDGSIGVGTTFTGDNGASAQKALEEAHKNPTQDLKDLGFTTLGGAEEETPAPEDDDSGMPWWVWLLAGLGVVGCVGALAAGARKKMGNDSVKLDDFMETQDQVYGEDPYMHNTSQAMQPAPPRMEMASI